MSKTKFCKHCGGQIDADATFCQHCGKNLGSVEPQVAPVKETVSDQPSGVPQQVQPVYRPPYVWKKPWEPYIPEDVPVTMDDIKRGLKFNFRSTVKISHSTSFTLVGLILFMVGGITTAASGVMALSLFGELSNIAERIQIFNLIFLALIISVLLYTFLVEFMLKNTGIEVSFIKGIRFTGFMSIILIIRAGLSIIYALYVFIFLGASGTATDVYMLYEFSSLIVVGAVFFIHLVIYIKGRIGMSTGLAIVYVVSSLVLAGIVFYSFSLMIFIITQYPIVNYLILAVSLLSPIGAYLVHKNYLN